MNNHKKGLLITIIGVFILTPDSLLIRLADAHYWTISFWRGLISSITVLTFLLIFKRKSFFHQCQTSPGKTFLSLVPYCIGSTLFIYSINNTLVSHSLVILATIPVFASIYSFFFLGEKISRITGIAIAMTTIGVIVIASGDFNKTVANSGNYLYGDIAAIGSALCFATNITFARANKNLNPLSMIALAGIPISIVSLFFAPTLQLATESWLPIIINSSFVVPVSFALILIGPRYISAPEVALLMLIETFLGSLWVWLGVGENPGPHAFIGGSIVVITLIITNLWKMKIRSNLYHKPVV